VNKFTRFPPLAAVLLLLGGCGLGEDNVLFVTKTSLGLDVDTKPPTLDFGFDRKEGTVAPVFENGQVLPQMAGFSSDVGIVNQAIGQSFATGTASLVMSKHLTDKTIVNFDPNTKNDPYSGVITTSLPKDKRKRYLCGDNQGENSATI
jgi:hypothetical protein